jgi:uncharacterized protein
VLPNESALETSDPFEVWDKHLEVKLDSYMGSVFEDIAAQAYVRQRVPEGLPIVREWGRWEGRDRDREPLEMDIACQLAGGGVLTGSVKWNREPLEARWHIHHLRMIDRLAAAGVKWAHSAKAEDAPIVYFAAGGFADDFTTMARAARSSVRLYSLADLYRE